MPVLQPDDQPLPIYFLKRIKRLIFIQSSIKNHPLMSPSGLVTIDLNCQVYEIGSRKSGRKRFQVTALYVGPTLPLGIVTEVIRCSAMVNNNGARSIERL